MEKDPLRFVVNEKKKKSYFILEIIGKGDFSLKKDPITLVIIGYMPLTLMERDPLRFEVSGIKTVVIIHWEKSIFIGGSFKNDPITLEIIRKYAPYISGQRAKKYPHIGGHW